jgi:glycosyltransferase involved in cell wall biosynthesis
MPDKYPKISIIIPSFNKVAYLSDTLNSIFSQKYPNLEVIIQDGGSTDGSLTVIKRYAKKYSGIISWVSRPDGGQLNAVCRGFKKATGKIMTYINADDVYTDNCLWKVGTHYIKHPETLWVVGEGKIIDSCGSPAFIWVTLYKNLLLNLNNYFLLLIVNYMVQPSVFVSASAYRTYGPFKGTSRFITEYDLWLRLGQVKMPVILNVYLSCFRMSAENISSTQSKVLMHEDDEIIKKYTTSSFILICHRINNLARLLIIKLRKC